MDTLLNERSVQQINELIKDNWEFSLHFGDHQFDCDLKLPSWEADFTKRLETGKWDNHKCGYSYVPDEAINSAYMNIKNGVRLCR
jgi:hypothetical protein